jgi:hypothetical protein
MIPRSMDTPAKDSSSSTSITLMESKGMDDERVVSSARRRDVFYNDLPASHFDIGLYAMSNEALLAKRQDKGEDDDVLLVGASKDCCKDDVTAVFGDFSNFKPNAPAVGTDPLKRRLQRRAMSLQNTKTVQQQQQQQHETSHNSGARSLKADDVEFLPSQLKHCVTTNDHGATRGGAASRRAFSMQHSSSSSHAGVGEESSLKVTPAAIPTVRAPATIKEVSSSSSKKTKKRRSKSIVHPKKQQLDADGHGHGHVDASSSSNPEGSIKKPQKVRRSKSIKHPRKSFDEEATVLASNTTSTKCRSNLLPEDEMTTTTAMLDSSSSSKKDKPKNNRSSKSNDDVDANCKTRKSARSRAKAAKTDDACSRSPSAPPSRRAADDDVPAFSPTEPILRRRSMDYVPDHKNTKTKARERSRSPSPHMRADDDDVRFSPTEQILPRRRSMDCVVADKSGGKSRVRLDFENKSVSQTASTTKPTPLRRRSKSIEVRATESSILETQRQHSEFAPKQPIPLRRRSRSIGFTERFTERSTERSVSNSDRSTDYDGLKAPSRRRARSTDMGIATSNATNCSRELLLVESGDDFVPLPNSSSGFHHQKAPKRRGVALGKAFSFRRNNKKFESLPDQGSGRDLSCGTSKNDSNSNDVNSNTSSSNNTSSGNSRPISKQLSLHNLVDWRNNNNDRIGSASVPGTPLAAQNTMNSMDMTISDRFGVRSNKVAPTPSVSCIQLSFAGEAVMTQLIKADFSN